MRGMSFPMKRLVSNGHLDISDGFDGGLGSHFGEGEDDDVREAAFEQAAQREADAGGAEDDRVTPGAGDTLDLGAHDAHEPLHLPWGKRDGASALGLLDR
jgi:hypothetical protein